MCANSCRYYYGSSSPSFPNLSPPRDMPQPHKTVSRKIQQFSEDPDSIEFCLDDEPTVSARYFKNGHCRHKTYDPQVRWSRNNIAVTMERFQPITSPSSTSETSSYTSHQDYSYAYYEPGAIMCHSNIPTPEEVAGPSNVLPPPNSMRALLIKTKEKPNKSQSTSRSYATHENIYEDVSDEKHRRLASSAQSLNERGCSKKEFQHILNNHYRVLEELNLSVEELLMSSSPPKDPALPPIVSRASQPCVTTLSTEMLSLDLKDDTRSPVSELVVGEDSGFSGSSSGASYIGSLRNYKTAITRSLRRSSAPNCSSGSGTIYGSCRTAKFPNESRIGSFYGTSQTKDNKSLDSSQKSLKFSIWNKRI
ncbi:uncharacterized protein LOC119077833 [Bradysia coprophila]|uniref:uncharacterized protein LOC119077833 n=1 Tax=Bradysia coprophila TaxID=38358 RepID=UPI00187D9032|nr:uncharacterized protein LOC119077833 [Bradysia coprophila]XP_037041045.1 uncharacterized protein LOC119077833 [Bradysia coprophila]